MSVTQHDMDSVQPGVYVTDVIIDFCSAWIMRHEVMKESNVLPMTTYFYSSLIKENGLQEVRRWLWKVDVFEKKNIFVPIHDALHWSLCVIVNPGYVADFDPNEEESGVEVPCMIFFDSLKCHSPLHVGNNLCMWLNAEWNWKHSNSVKIFTPFTMKSFSPKG